MVVFFALWICGCGRESGPMGPFSRWQTVEISFQGPNSAGLGEPNPFSVHLDVEFAAPDGRGFTVPGFYDGDGRGGLDGNVWKVRFSADQNGVWTYTTQSPQSELHGLSGRFEVGDPSPDAPIFFREGRLEYVGRPYLKFRDGGSWLKVGADEPENLLGKAFGLDDWASKRQQMDYLAERGINSIYVMTHTLDGDEDDVWPWVGASSEEAKTQSDRYDVAKLQKWRDFFEYVQEKGIVIQLVLEDDSAWTGYDKGSYYREIVARFGDLPAIYFNVGEEYNENYSLEEAIDFMTLLGEIDPYDHPRAIHNVRIPEEAYIDSPELQVTSVQTWPSSPTALNQLAVDWRQACLARGKRPLVVSFDEARPAEDRKSWWSVYLGGGVWEGLILVPEGYAATEPVWKQLAATKTFMETLPFDTMFPANHLVRKGRAFCLARPGEVYALYLPEGGSVEVDLASADDGGYRVEWFDPREGRFLDAVAAGVVQGGRQRLEAPDSEDWAVRITREGERLPTPPTAASAKRRSVEGQAVAIRLSLFDEDPGGHYEYEIVQQPKNGTLTGTGADRAYSPKKGFTGRDTFQWRVSSQVGLSNTATVVVYASASGDNSVPKVEDRTITLQRGRPRSFILTYTDPDGPGPYEVRVRRPPAQGTIQGTDNDITYTPKPGFTGKDGLEWEVSDGLGRSRRAKVTLIVR